MGPLAGLKILEIRGLGPAPYAGMLLADLGADVTVIERSTEPTGVAPPAQQDVHMRGKRSLALDLKNPRGLETLLSMVEQVDALIEGFRPGVAERLGFGPQDCQTRNPALVYGRVTGWGQTGPLSQAAGHDINYIALTGVLAAIGTERAPSVPLNLIGDYAGGSLFLVVGMLAALLERQASGRGQVIDAAITDGSASLMSLIYTLHAVGRWQPKRQQNFLDGGAPFYDVYATADNEFVAIGPLEPHFLIELCERIGVPPPDPIGNGSAVEFLRFREALRSVFAKKSRAAWCDLLDGTDVCFAPVLNYLEAPEHAHHQARSTYVSINDIVQPAPAPRFNRSVPTVPTEPSAEGADWQVVLQAFGFSAAEVDELKNCGALKT